jgi:superfamily I DNA/RNA helicase
VSFPRERQRPGAAGHAAAARVAKNPPYAHVVADESQDFGHAELVLLRALVPKGADDLFLCSDAGQRIYKAAAPWTAAGVDTRGRSARLSVNYRTTEEICTFAEALLPDSLDEGEGSEKRSAVSLLSGPRPEVHAFENVSAEIGGLASWLTEIVAQGIALQDIGVFARTESVLRNRVEKAFQSARLRFEHLTDEGAGKPGCASIGSTHRAKGLEFRAVAVAGCDADLFPLASVRREIEDEADRAAFDEQERQLLYVATTRARERLWIGYTGRPTTFLDARSQAPAARGPRASGR